MADLQALGKRGAWEELLGTRSTTVSARRLGYSQSSVSHALARQRKQFRDPELVRVGRSLSPTRFAGRGDRRRAREPRADAPRRRAGQQSSRTPRGVTAPTAAGELVIDFTSRKRVRMERDLVDEQRRERTDR